MIDRDLILGTFSYVFGLQAGMLAASGGRPRRPRFFPRVILYFLLAFVFRYALVLLLRTVYNGNQSMIRHVFPVVSLLTSAILVWSLHRCIEDCGLWASLFFGTLGCCLQYLTYKLYWLISLFRSFDKVGETVLILGVTCLCYAAVRRMLFCRLDLGEAPNTRHVQNLLATLLGACIIFSDSFLRLGALEYHSLWVDLVVWGLSVLMIVMVMLLELSILLFFKVSDERDMLRQMLESQREQYRIEQRNIELINIKCHDLRHMLRRRGAGLMDETVLNDLAESISIYDARMDTGSDALTVVLDKYAMYCEQHGIRITCMVDGARLSHIPAYKQYAMFGNAVENAVKAVRHLEKEKRVISITQQTSGDLINIRIANYFDGRVDYEGAMPVSREENHGYGVKSIRLVAEEYGGSIRVRNTGDLFILNILLPLPSGEERAPA